MDAIKIDKTLQVYSDNENGRKYVFPTKEDNLSFAETVALVHNGYTVVPQEVKDKITEMCIKKEMELTWGKNHPLKKYV